MAGPLGAGEGSQAKIEVVGVHNQTETLGRRLVPSKNCVLWKIVEGRAGEWPAGRERN